MDDEKGDAGFYQTPIRKTKKEVAVVSGVDDDKTRLLKDSEISIILEDYDGIFSDFDPRPYSIRSLSDDFLPEVKRASKDKPNGSIEFRLLIPSNKRSLEDENTIKKRLKEHFKRHYDLLVKEARRKRVLGFSMIGIGAVLGILATLLNPKGDSNFFFKFILILMEPASWFNIWEGMNQIFFHSKDNKEELDFYGKMIHSEIVFIGY